MLGQVLPGAPLQNGLLLEVVRNGEDVELGAARDGVFFEFMEVGFVELEEEGFLSRDGALLPGLPSQC